jgi:hypothetical protein
MDKMNKMDKMDKTESTSPSLVSRRDVLRGAAIGVAAALASSVPRVVSAQSAPTKTPVKLTFWTWENPQRPYQHSGSSSTCSSSQHLCGVPVLHVQRPQLKVSIGTRPDAA